MTASLSAVWPPMVTTWPQGPITPHGEYWLANGVRPEVAYTSSDRSQIFQLMGGFAGVPGVQPCVSVRKIAGLMPPSKLFDQQGARQDGVTNMGAVLDPITIRMECLIDGKFPRATLAQAAAMKRKITRLWMESWAADDLGEFSWKTPNMGRWWGLARASEVNADELAKMTNATQSFRWTPRIDRGLWQSTPSTSQFPRPGDPPLVGSASGWLPLSNRGDRAAYHTFLCYGPFDLLSIANGPGSASMVKFGPLLNGQIAVLNTDQRLPTVIDLSPSRPAQVLDPFQALVKALISFASNNNISPQLQQFESQFGILPPQTVLTALLQGRFTKPIPRKPIGAPPVTSHIRVELTGAGPATRIVAGLIPLRRWPE